MNSLTYIFVHGLLRRHDIRSFYLDLLSLIRGLPDPEETKNRREE